MDVQIKRTAEALEQRDRVGAGGLFRKARLLDQVRGDDAVDDAQHLAHDRRPGHYGCGGVQAALEDTDHSLIDNWLRHIKDVCRFNNDKLEGLEHQHKIDRLCELNVIEQVTNVCNTTIVNNTWKNGADLYVHGWIYNIKNGILNDLSTWTKGEQFDNGAEG